MVRFIINLTCDEIEMMKRFTFHYGQIYYHKLIVRFLHIANIYIPLWLDLLYMRDNLRTFLTINLHSTMVRFIIVYYDNFKTYMLRFTFHYGQIYYSVEDTRRRQSYEIYIPLWLDLLSIQTAQDLLARKNLHSTMVRFIMIMKYGKMV